MTRFWITSPYRLGSGVRWNNTGLLIVGAAFAIIALVRLLARRPSRRNSSRQNLDPSTRQKA